MPEDVERRVKRIRFFSSSAMKAEQEAKYHQKMIMEFSEIKRENFARQDALMLANHQKVKGKKKLIKRRPTTKLVLEKKKKSEGVAIVSNEATEQLKEYIVKEMKGEEVKVVIQKRLFPSDLLKSQNRLNMPVNQLETHDFLTENEKKDLENDKEFAVELLGPGLKMHEKPMYLKKWHLKSSDNYVLKTNWNNFVKENGKDLETDTLIQVLSFRKHEKLHFAIACLESSSSTTTTTTDVDHGQNAALAIAPPPPHMISFLPPAPITHSQCSLLPPEKIWLFGIELMPHVVNHLPPLDPAPITDNHLPPTFFQFL